VIVGRVVDDVGDPVVGARVSAESPRGGRATATADTDDRGEYRLPLQPGEAFLISVMTGGTVPVVISLGNGLTGTMPSAVRTYYPGVEQREEATAVTLRPAEEAAISFSISGAKSARQPFSVFGALPVGGIAGARPGESPITGRGTVDGRVVDAGGRPLAFAQVVLRGIRPRTLTRATRADLAGRFQFDQVPNGSYEVLASKAGYQALAPARVNAFTDQGRRETAEVRLAPWGNITGRVVDEFGDPVQDASVQLLEVRYENGRRQLAAAGGGARRTDDRGEFRLFGLEPGRYVVSASVGELGAADHPGYTRSYYPGTATASSAQVVTLARSEQAQGIDVELIRARTFRIAGRLIDASGQPTTGGSLQLLPSRRSGSVTAVPIGARIDPTGAFEFRNVPPDRYVIHAYRGRQLGTQEGEFGALPVTVSDADVTGLVLPMTAGSTITGTVTFDSFDVSKHPSAAGVRIEGIPVDFDQSPNSNWALAEPRPDGAFVLAGLHGPRRLAVSGIPPGWALKEIRVAGIDVTDRALAFGQASQSLSSVTVVMTDRLSELRARVVDDRSRPLPGVDVLVFPGDRGRWYPFSRFFRHAVTGDDGRVSIAGLPADSYYVVAASQLPYGGGDGWQDPEWLESVIGRARSVTLGEGQAAAVDLGP
jgi:hypothetical protein